MNFKQDISTTKFNFVSIDKFVNQYHKNNSDTDTDDLRENLSHFKTLKLQGQKCDCGNPIWIIGSAITGLGCFTCISGDTDSSNDYEIK